MIQATIYNNTVGNPFFYTQYTRGPVGDNFTVTPVIDSAIISGTTYYYITFPYFLFKLESTETGKIKYYCKTHAPSYGVGTGVDKHKRWISFLFFYSVSTTLTEDLSESKLIVGTDDFPMGFYNFTIYQTETAGELNPDNATATLYEGLLNMTGSDNDSDSLNFQDVKYKEYTDNDSDTESIYLTNPL
tara:strand:+ start:3098 stop:3661 length:564 start_codon:yes stop_codon:yes gene_type:complete